MKKLLVVFGLLDLITLVRGIRQISEMITGLTGPFWSLALTTLILYASLIASAYFLLRQQKAGIWITYAQFPFRIMYQTMSFGFIWMLEGQFSSPTAVSYITMTLVVLEIVRLLITILIHRKSF